jgi:hypothetical protein
MPGLLQTPENIKVHVIPAEVGAHIGLLGAFAIAGFADDAPGIVYFESPDEGETTTDPARLELRET